MQFTKTLKTLAITASGIGLVSLALAAHPGQANFFTGNSGNQVENSLASNTTADVANSLGLLAQMPDAPDPDMQRPGDGSPRTDKGWMREIGLSQAQLQQIKTIRERYQPQLQANREAVKKARDEFQQLMRGTASDNQLRQKHSELVNLHQQGDNLRFESMLAIRGVMTPEQRQKAAEFMDRHREQMREQMRERMEGMQERGQNRRGNLRRNNA
jgi:Spy/CpxP family protein refolding chaperone